MRAQSRVVPAFAVLKKLADRIVLLNRELEGYALAGRALRSLQIEGWARMLSTAMVLDRRFIQDPAVTFQRRNAPPRKAESVVGIS